MDWEEGGKGHGGDAFITSGGVYHYTGFLIILISLSGK